MMCHRIGFPPISIIGFGRTDVSSLKRVPSPPARITAFNPWSSEHRAALLAGQYVSPADLRICASVRARILD
jgi:hypothetical protein